MSLKVLNIMIRKIKTFYAIIINKIIKIAFSSKRGSLSLDNYMEGDGYVRQRGNRIRTVLHTTKQLEVGYWGTIGTIQSQNILFHDI